MEILQATESAGKIRENKGNAENQNIPYLTKMTENDFTNWTNE